MKYLSFDVGIKNLAFCSLNEDKKILDWGIINLNRDPVCQCGLQKPCSKTATYQITDNNETKYLTYEELCVINKSEWKSYCKIHVDSFFKIKKQFC